MYGFTPTLTVKAVADAAEQSLRRVCSSLGTDSIPT